MTRETLEQFAARTWFVHKPWEGGMDTSAGLHQKVGADGEMKTYLGDTVVFDLDSETCRWLRDAQSMLYDAFGEERLAKKRLPLESFHVTLHDLVSGAAKDCASVLAEMPARREKTQALLEAFKREYPAQIRMRMAAMMCMVNTSVVVAFEPAAQEDCDALMEMYGRLQEVAALGHRLTPHATIAYFRPGSYDADTMGRLRWVIERVNEKYAGREVVLDQEWLRYCCFADMMHYTDERTMRAALRAKGIV